jgi:APA family basic amino acid/polyamine antiporter
MVGAGKYTLSVATAMVIANMIGTGVFTSLGYQVGPLPSGFTLLMLWLVGGMAALCGALTYAEISSTLRLSGGEYLFLSRLIHPAAGAVAGWLSLVVGFSGAIAAVAIAIGEYSRLIIPSMPVQGVGAVSILLIAVIHLRGVKAGGAAQNFLTGFKLTLIAVLCIAPFLLPGESTKISFSPSPRDLDLIFSPGFAVALVFVLYAYTGWNASTYIAGNLENPSRNLPLSLGLGTATVTLIYLALNGTFLNAATFAELEGQNDIGNIVALKLFGNATGTVFSGLFSFALLSTLSAMTIAGPRVAEAMGKDLSLLKNFTRSNRFGMPWIAILAQAAFSILLVLFSNFVAIIQYVSVSLTLSSFFGVISVFILRRRFPRESRPFSTPLYPLVPVLYLATALWMILFVTLDNPLVIVYSILTMVPGVLLYYVQPGKAG